MLSYEYIKEQVLELLPIDSELYSGKLNILVKGAMNKLTNEGVDSNLIEEDSIQAFDYCTCVAYQVALDIDADADFEKTTKMYITRVNTLRTSLNV